MRKIEKIIAKFLCNSISNKELDELHVWLKKQKNEQFLYDFVKVDYITNYIMNKYDNQEIKKQLLAKIKNDKKTIYWVKVRETLKYAAIAIVFIISTLFYWHSNQQQEQPQLIIEDESITLQLANGDTKIIKEDGTFEMVNEKGEVIIQQNGEHLNYTGESNSKTLKYNQLSVPFGKQIQLTLSDGSIVHLNAGSSLKYPIEFLEGEEYRQVFLQGEAFFDIAKDESFPFVVNTDGINVQVLGTQFNVSSYSDDPTIHVVLVEGSVELYRNSAEKDNELVVLVPGHKGELSKGGNGDILVQEVNTLHYTSWINGELLFRKSTLGNMLRILERHYNITIVNTNKDMEKILFNASFRKEPIENILTYLDDVLGIEYSIENNMVIIN